MCPRPPAFSPQSVEVLSLSINKITGLKDFRFAQRLQELYLRKNDIADIREVQWLTGLPELRVLWLTENPCAEHPYYRQIVAALLPGLEKLDNTEITPQEREAAINSPAVAAFISQVGGEPAEPGSRPSSARPGTAHGYGAHQQQHSEPERRYSHVVGPPPPQPHPPAISFEPAQRSSKNILYAVMALLNELPDEDLLFVKREVDGKLHKSQQYR